MYENIAETAAATARLMKNNVGVNISNKRKTTAAINKINQIAIETPFGANYNKNTYFLQH